MSPFESPACTQPSPLTTSTTPDAAYYLEQLQQRGWAHIPGFLRPTLMMDLRNEAIKRPEWSPAAVGLNKINASEIRRDRTIWMDKNTACQRQYFDAMEQIRSSTNEFFFAGLFEYEAHFSHYPPGAFYKMHVDALKGRGARVLTTVAYLNAEWKDGDGGELVLYRDDEKQIEAKLAPIGGDLVLFWSEQFPHEVLTAQKDRYAVSGWFRRNIEPANPL